MMPVSTVFASSYLTLFAGFSLILMLTFKGAVME